MSSQGTAAHDPNLTWTQSLQQNKGETFKQLWHGFADLATKQYGWNPPKPWAGEAIYFEFNAGLIDQVYIWARSNQQKLFEGAEILPTEVLSVQFRYGRGQQHVKENVRRDYLGYTAIISPSKTKGKDSTHVYIGVKEWPTSIGIEARSDAIKEACVAAIQIFKELTKIMLPGVPT